MDSRQVQSISSFVAYSAYVATVIVISGQMSERVPEPYMDEIFHVAQAQRYCQGKWTEWDDKITTPPGLYIIPALFHQTIPSWFNCSIERLRYINGFLLMILPIINSRILSYYRKIPYPNKIKKNKPKMVRFLIPEDDIIIEGIVIACFPILYFYGFLFYNDLGSLVLILACYDQSLVERHYLAGLLGIWSCMFRQTNIIWVGFITGSTIMNRLKKLNMNHQYQQQQQQNCKNLNEDDRRKNQIGFILDHNRPLMDASILDLPNTIKCLILNIIEHFNELSKLILPYLMVLICFITFLIWNDGIVLGDKSNHKLVFHIPQLYYFFGFCTFFLLPLTLDRYLISKTLLSLFGSIRGIFTSIFICGFMMWTVHNFTYEHPFLLSDNRHYTFYIWRRVFKAHESVKYILVPIYMISMRLILERLARSYTMNLMITTFYMIGICLTLIPTSLIEPRYYLIPMILIRLHIRPIIEETKRWSLRLLIEFLCYLILNLLTIYMFLFKPFLSPFGMWENQVQRFIW